MKPDEMQVLKSQLETALDALVVKAESTFEEFSKEVKEREIAKIGRNLLDKALVTVKAETDFSEETWAEIEKEMESFAGRIFRDRAGFEMAPREEEDA